MDHSKQTPPAWATRFLAWFCKEDYYEDIQGDLEEEFQLLATGLSPVIAKKWYKWQVIRLFRPSMIKKVKTQDSIEKETAMFRNYLKIGTRNLWKYKSSSLINIIGLATGLAAFIIISLFVKDEFSYDKHHKHAENTFRVTVKNYDTEGAISRQWAFASAGHARRLKEDYSDITHAVRFHPWAFPDISFEDKKFPSEQVIFAGDDVFNIFSFKFIQGNPETALTDLYSLVLTEQTAIKIFGNDWVEQDILGEQVTLSRSGQTATFKITGVMEDMPEQQHFHFEYLAPIRFIEMIYGEETVENVGGNYNWITYVRISPNSEVPQLQRKINDEFWDKYIGKVRGGTRDAKDFYEFEFQPLLDIHLRSNLEGEYETNGSIQQVYIFSIVGILLLLVACVNYMNLATSHYSRRLKEVGVRKVVGALKSSLVKQFLTESALVTIISLPLATLLVHWSLPFLNVFVGKNLTLGMVLEGELLSGLVVLLMSVSVIAGLYPAVFLSKINLVTALKGEQSINSSKWNFRSWLVTFQYAVTIALIFSLLVIDRQMKFINNTDPGYQKNQILHVNLSRSIENLEVFKQEILNHPNIESGAFSSRIPTGRLADSWGSSFFRGDSLTPTNFRLPFICIDEDFLRTFEIPLIAGENFTRDQEMAEDSIGYYIINRAASEALGYNDPEEIIGKKLGYGPFNGRSNDGFGGKTGSIQGVVENFNFESLHSKIVPMVMLKANFNYRRLALKIKEDDLQTTLGHVENTWSKFDQETSINYRFLDDMFAEQYQQEQRLGTMIKVFTGIAILIGCLGLIGMVGFIIETKLKEIGIRKALGASTQSIWMLVSNRFMVLIAIAFIISIPWTYWLMNGWLENFVYRTDISAMLIILPIILTILITLISTSYQTFKAAMINPVECLKDE